VVGLVVKVTALRAPEDRISTPQAVRREQVEIECIALLVQFGQQALVGVDVPGGLGVLTRRVVDGLADSSSERVVAVLGDQLALAVPDRRKAGLGVVLVAAVEGAVGVVLGNQAAVVIVFECVLDAG
jgi:hypothetical protein